MYFFMWFLRRAVNKIFAPLLCVINCV